MLYPVRELYVCICRALVSNNGSGYLVRECGGSTFLNSSEIDITGEAPTHNVWALISKAFFNSETAGPRSNFASTTRLHQLKRLRLCVRGVRDREGI